MLDQFVVTAEGGAKFFASFLPASLLRRDDYHGTEWRFVKATGSAETGLVRHSLRWIRKECRRRSLTVRAVRHQDIDFGGQTWLCIERA